MLDIFSSSSTIFMQGYHKSRKSGKVSKEKQKLGKVCRNVGFLKKSRSLTKFEKMSAFVSLILQNYLFFKAFKIKILLNQTNFAIYF